MATTRYFSDRLDGTSIEIAENSVRGVPNALAAALFPGVTTKKYDSFDRMAGLPVGFSSWSETLLPVTRCVTHKGGAGRHECNARCLNAKGHSDCECKCGGANHGKGMRAE